MKGDTALEHIREVIKLQVSVFHERICVMYRADLQM